MKYEHLNFNGFLGKHAHLGVTGSIAAYKSLELLRGVINTGATVSATLTASASKFITPLSYQALGATPVYHDLFQPEQSIFAHLEPGRDADCLAIVPCTANFLAKLAYGLADDMLSTQALAFSKPIILAPAMNPMLWNATATKENWTKLKARGYDCIEPECGEMACGDEGKGRLPSLELIFIKILKALSPQDLYSKRILINLGPTQEYFDAARFWSNPSSGLMGSCIAIAAWLRGAEVTVVKGPCKTWFPDDITVINVINAKSMYEACVDNWAAFDIGCMTAAVADFSPIPFDVHKKYKKNASEHFTIEFTKTNDILLALGKMKSTHQKLIGFCAETDNLELQAQDKLQRKECDLIVANKIGKIDSGFGSHTNDVYILDSSKRSEWWPNLKKTEIAWRIWDCMVL